MWYILENKKPVKIDSITEWAEKFNQKDKRVAYDTIGDIIISTVFLGLDHSFNSGKPLLFETMIFGGEHDQYQDRYHTWEEAEEGHKKAVELVNKK